MKKLLLFALLATMMVGCSSSAEKDAELCKNRYHIIVLDSCEYYSNNYTFDLTHKGNCKFCAERNKKMIKEQIDSALIEIFD